MGGSPPADARLDRIEQIAAGLAALDAEYSALPCIDGHLDEERVYLPYVKRLEQRIQHMQTSLRLLLDTHQALLAAGR